MQNKLEFQYFQILVVWKISFTFHLSFNTHTWQNYQVPKVPEFLKHNLVASHIKCIIFKKLKSPQQNTDLDKK